VRRTCLAVLTMLIAQYALGVFLNIFVTIPASDKHASMLGEITSGPFALTVHALLGLSLLGTAIVLLARAVRLEDPALIALATIALAAIGGAFAAGEVFVKDGGQDSASFTMGLLGGIAMLCYVGMLALISAPQRRHARLSDEPPAHARTETSGLLAGPSRSARERGRARPEGWTEEGWTEEGWTEEGWTEEGWTEEGWSEEGWPRDPWAEPAWSEPAWPGPAWSGQPQAQPQPPPPLPVRQPQDRTVMGVTWEAPWSRGPQW
jgi:hypothetical protein